jgi:hypothetical protein
LILNFTKKSRISSKRDARLWHRPTSDPSGTRFAVTKTTVGLGHDRRPRH